MLDPTSVTTVIDSIRQLADARLFREARGRARTAAAELAEPSLKEGPPELRTRAAFAAALASVGEGRWARIHLDRAIKHAERGLPQRGAELASLLVLQAQVSSQVVYYPELEPLLKRAVALREQASGPDHPETGLALVAWAELILAHWHAYLARPIARRARAILEPVQGALAPVVLRCREMMLLAGRQNADPAKLAGDLAGLHELRERVQGADHADLLPVCEALLEIEPELEDGERWCRRAQALAAKVKGADHPRVALLDVLLAERYLRASETAKAHARIESALASLEAAWDADHPDRMPVFGKLTMLLVWAEPGPETEGWRARMKVLKDPDKK